MLGDSGDHIDGPQGLPLFKPPYGRITAIDLNTGDIAHWLKIERQVTEIYDVIAIPGAMRPMSLGLKNDEIERLLILE